MSDPQDYYDTSDDITARRRYAHVTPIVQMPDGANVQFPDNMPPCDSFRVVKSSDARS
jgi:hypothetical protein